MMLLLLRDVFADLFALGCADGEGAIALLPGKRALADFLMHPARRNRFFDLVPKLHLGAYLSPQRVSKCNLAFWRRWIDESGGWTFRDGMAILRTLFMADLEYDPLRGMNPEVRRKRGKLGEAMMRFVQAMMQHGIEDAALRQHETEIYRLAVEEAAKEGIETALTWHSLGMWTEDGRERVGYFSRALECMESGRDAGLAPENEVTKWSNVHMRADCLYEIGRIHAHEGDPSVARDFLTRALPLSQEAERLRAPAKITHEDNLEGKIMALLVQLPDADDEAQTPSE